jgi:tetratricopeptide (TPR) repeat protein
MFSLAEQLRSAIGLQQRGQLSQARAICDALLRINPRHVEALHLLGVIAYQQRQFDKTVELIGKAIAISPRTAGLYARRGIALRELNKLDSALADFSKAISLIPDIPEMYINRGNIFMKLRKLDAAIADYTKAISIRPDVIDGYINRGVALQELNKFDAAIADYDKAIAIRPDHSGLYCNRGNALKKLRRLEAAIADYDKAISLGPDLAEVYSNRGTALQELNRLDAAIADFNKAVSLRPDLAEVYINRGNALRDLRKLDAAIRDFNQAISINPDLAAAYWNKALTLLLKGDFQTGFELFEWRWKNPHLNLKTPHFVQPLWLGQQPLQDKRILLHSEQGLGDTLQFCRYASPLARSGAHVFLQVPRPLVALLQRLEGVGHVLAEGDRLPDFDYQSPIMSLPLAFKTDLNTIPGQKAYLHADQAKVRNWNDRIGKRTKLKVGLVWSGGFRPDQPELWGVNERRNIRLDIFARMLNEIDMDFFSLQKGEPAESEIRYRELEFWPRGNFENFVEDIHDFSDTAAFVANLDLVVSVDTSTAHLAAALGKPTWILNRFDTCWRWLLDRDDSPWYPSVKLYRQDESQRWEPVLQRVAVELTKLVDEHRANG